MGSYPERPGEIMLDTHILEVFGVENIEFCRSYILACVFQELEVKL